MKYFEATASTPYCGEELTGFYMAESEDALRESGKLDELIDDCVAEWFDSDEYDTYGFDCPEDYEEYYYADSSVVIREITKEWAVASLCGAFLLLKEGRYGVSKDSEG